MEDKFSYENLFAGRQIPVKKFNSFDLRQTECQDYVAKGKIYIFYILARRAKRGIPGAPDGACIRAKSITTPKCKREILTGQYRVRTCDLSRVRRTLFR
jgi:hypothetical protein